MKYNKYLVSVGLLSALIIIVATDQCYLTDKQDAIQEYLSDPIAGPIINPSIKKSIIKKKPKIFQDETCPLLTGDQLICINDGSNLICTKLLKNYKAGLRKVIIYNCTEMEDGDFMCDWIDNKWFDLYKNRIVIPHNKTRVKCENKDNCKFIYHAHFKKGGADFNFFQNFAKGLVSVAIALSCLIILFEKMEE